MQAFNIVRYCILASGIVLMIWFIIPLAMTGGFNLGIVTGLVISAVLIVYGICGVSINTFVADLWQHVWGKIIELLIAFIAACILILACATSFSMLSAANNRADPGCTVIVLGAKVYKDHISTALKNRLDAALIYLSENPESDVIVSGGQGSDEPCTESSLMYQYLLDNGISNDRIYQESESRHTSENLSFSKRIIEEQGLCSDIAIATEGYHEYRAIKYAEREGMMASAIPAATVWWLFPCSVIREMYGILEMWFLK